MTREAGRPPGAATRLRQEPARPGQPRGNYRDWLLVAQVASLVVFGIWLVLAGQITFGGPAR